MRANEVQISPRLMPGILIGGAWVQVEPTDRTDPFGKSYWRTTIDIPGAPEYDNSDLCGWGDAREMLTTLCSFLSACAEGRDFEERTGAESDNGRIFPEHIGVWAQANSDELSLAGMDEDDLDEVDDQNEDEVPKTETLFELIVVGNKFVAARMAANRKIPFAFHKEQNGRTYGRVGLQHLDRVRSWFDELADYGPIQPGALLAYHIVAVQV